MNTPSHLKSVDILKFIMAFAVIGIHVEAVCLPAAFPYAEQWFNSLAVPFYFIVSGFLLGRKLNTADTVEIKSLITRKRSIKIFRIWLCWLAVYLPISILLDIRYQAPAWRCVLSYVKGVITSGTSGYAWTLWFLYSMGIVLFIISVAIKRTRKWQTECLCAFLTITMFSWSFDKFILPTYSNIITHTFSSFLNNAFGGGLYIMVGIALSDYELNITSKSKTAIYIFSFLTIATSFIIWDYLKPIAVLFGGVPLFLLAYRVKLPGTGIYIVLRRLSMWIYYIHMIVIFSVIELSVHLRLWPTYLAVSVISLTIAIILDRAAAHPRFAWLNFMIS